MTKITIEDINGLNNLQQNDKDEASYGLWRSETILLKKYFNPQDYILDIGCGNGRTTIGLMENGYKNIVGFEDSKEKLVEAEANARDKKFCIEFTDGDIFKLNFDDETFDKVLFLHNGLMYLKTSKQRKLVLKEIERILKKDGICIFTTHDRELEKFKDFWLEEKQKWQENKQDKGLNEFGDLIFIDNEEKQFIHIPSYQEIKNLIKHCDFELLESEMRSEIMELTNFEQTHFGECRFYVVKKKAE